MTSPGCSARAAGLSGSTSVTTAPRVVAGMLELAGDVRREVVERDAESGAGIAAGASSLGLPARLQPSRSSSSTLTLSVRSLPSRSTFTGTVVPGVVADHA